MRKSMVLDLLELILTDGRITLVFWVAFFLDSYVYIGFSFSVDQCREVQGGRLDRVLS